jgi:hypothetical protein
MGWFRVGFGLVIATALVLGCGGKTVPVDGRVKFSDGSDVSVLAGYAVAFEAEAAKASGVGEIQPDGSFKISTFGANDGALPGKHRVSISPPASPDPDKPPAKSKLPAKYEDPSTSGLTAEVAPGKAVEIVLERAP